MRRRETLNIGAAVPGPLVSVAAAAVAVAAGSLIGMPAGWTALIAASVLLSGAMRLIGGAWIAAGALVIALAASDPSPWRTATVIAAVHLLQVLGSLMLVVPLRSRVALRGLAPTAVRFAIVQAFCQAFGLLAWLLPTRSGLPAAVLVSAAGVLLFAVVVVLILRTRRVGAFPYPETSGGTARPSAD